MKLRNREVTGNEDTASWTSRTLSSAKRFQGQDGCLVRKARSRLGKRLGRRFRNQEQGRGWTPSPPASIDGGRYDFPYRLNVEIPESSDNNGRGWDVVGEADRAPAVPPRNDRIYPSSKIVWRYEVETESEIYRISTVPTDFIGNSSLQGEDWTPSTKAAYKNYKFMEDAVAIAETNLRNGPVSPRPGDNGRIVSGQATSASNLQPQATSAIETCRASA